MPAAMPAVRRKGWRAATVAGGVLAFAWMAGSPAVAGGSTVPSAASAMVGAPAMALTGVTLGPGGRVLSGVEIRVSSLVPGGSFLPQRVRSDARGHFSVGNLPPGEYRVIALKGGYAVLIGQINTLVQDTLELILRPAGDPGPPGTRPADGSWTLRLPRRDVLEDLEDGAAGDASAGPPVAPRLAGAPLMFEMRVSNTEGPSEDSRPVPGVEAFLSGSGALGRVGLVSGSLRHRGDSRSAAFNDVADQARLGWVSPPSKGSRLAADLEFLRQLRGLEDEEPAPGSWPELDSELEAWRLSLRELRPVSPGAPAFAVELDLVRGFQDGTDPAAAPGNFLARRANASLTTARRWHRHDLTVAGSVRSAGGAFLEQDEPADVVSAAVPRGLRALGSADGTAFQLGVTDRVSVASGLELTGRAVADATATGVYRGTRAAAVIGAQWTTPSGLRVRADAGMTAGRRSRGLLGLSADGSVGPVEWSAGYAREAGPVEDRASLLQGPGLVTDY
ncbi:MAG: carboxypeptidase regulatory-like domain-containing protein [Acidobacteria bacterium]|nr:carboxypeptidase regulatory-like domain-containing protein [Acidobacteriota bacterium]